MTGAAVGELAAGALPSYDSQVENILRGSFEANVPKALWTTTKAFVMAFTTPVTVLGNLGLTAQRSINAAFGETTWERAANPVDQMMSQWWDEIKTMAELYATGDTEEIRDATTNDYGYIALLGAGWMLRGATANTAKPMAKMLASNPASKKIAALVAEQIKQGKTAIGNTNVGRAVKERKDSGQRIMRTGIATGIAENRQKALVGKVNKQYEQMVANRTGRAIVVDLQQREKEYEADFEGSGKAPLDPRSLANYLATKGLPLDETTLPNLQKLQGVSEGERRVIEALIDYSDDLWVKNGPVARTFEKMYSQLRINNEQIIAPTREQLNPQDDGPSGERIQPRDTDRERVMAETLVTWSQLIGEEPDPRPLTQVLNDEEALKERRKELLAERARIQKFTDTGAMTGVIVDRQKEIGQVDNQIETIIRNSEELDGEVVARPKRTAQAYSALTRDAVESQNVEKAITAELQQVEKLIKIYERSKGESPEPPPYNPTSDGVRGTQWFHGTTVEFDARSFDARRGNPFNRFTSGLYLLSDPKMSADFARLRDNDDPFGPEENSPRVYSTTVAVHNPVDLMAPVSPSIEKVIRGLAADLDSKIAGSGVRRTDGEIIRIDGGPSITERMNDPDLVAPERGGPPEGSAGHLLERLRLAVSQRLTEAGLSREQAARAMSDYQQIASEAFMRAGYDGLVYQTSRIWGPDGWVPLDRPTNVLIVLTPNQSSIRDWRQLETTPPSTVNAYLQDLQKQRSRLEQQRTEQRAKTRTKRKNAESKRRQLERERQRIADILERRGTSESATVRELIEQAEEAEDRLRTAQAIELPGIIAELEAINRRLDGEATVEDLANVGLINADDPELEAMGLAADAGTISVATVARMTRRIRVRKDSLMALQVRLRKGEKLPKIVEQMKKELADAQAAVQERGPALVERMRNPIQHADEFPELQPEMAAALVRVMARDELDDLQMAVDSINDNLLQVAAVMQERVRRKERQPYQNPSKRQVKRAAKITSRPVSKLDPVEVERLLARPLTSREEKRVHKAINQERRIIDKTENRLKDRITEAELDNLLFMMAEKESVREKAAQQKDADRRRWIDYQMLMMDMVDKYRAAIASGQVVKAIFLSHNPADWEVDAAPANRRDPNLQTPVDKRSDMVLAARGDVDRTWDAYQRTVDNLIEAEKNLNLTKWVIGNATVTITINGVARNTFRKDEFKKAEQIYRRDTGRDLFDDYLYLDKQFLTFPERFSRFLQIDLIRDANPARLVSKTSRTPGRVIQGRIDTALTEFEQDNATIVAERGAAAERSAGREYVLIDKNAVIMLHEQTKVLNGAEKALYNINRVSSRLVLGTSLSWMFAQPFAEMAVLLAQHPIKAWPALKEARHLAKTDPEALMLLSAISRGTLGVDPAMNRRLSPTTQGTAVTATQRALGPGLQRKVAKGTRLMKMSPGYGLLDQSVRTPSQRMLIDTVTGKSFGQFDQWKGAWIREAGLLAEMDSQVKGWRRAMKAVKGQIDIIEENADRMGRMTRKEQLKFINSDEGIEVGMALAKHIDDQLGNWVDLRPGLEQTVGNLIFFYPFVRFSLTWMLRTYPRDHPVVWTTANLLGLATAKQLEELVQFDPVWPNEWAIAPLYGGEGENSAPTGYIPVNRFSPGGNVLTETVLSRPEASNAGFEIMMRMLPPLATQPLSLLFQRDRYGNPIQDAETDPLNPTAAPLTQLGFALDNFANLTAHFRLLNQGMTAFGPWTGDFSFQQWLDPTADGKFKERNELGEDPNKVRSIIRNGLLAGWPMPMHTITDKNFVANKQDEYNRFAATTGPEYTFRGKREISHPKSGKTVNFRAWAEEFTRIDDIRRETTGRGLPRTPYIRQLVKRYLDLKYHTTYGAPKEQKALLEWYRSYEALGLEPPSWMREKIEQQDRERRGSVRASFWNEFPDATKFPGNKQAKTTLDAIEAGGGTVGEMSVNTPGAAASLTNRTSTPARERVTEQLMEGTLKRLKLDDNLSARVPIVRMIYLSDPTQDPETKVRKNGFVAKYRGVEVVGNVKLEDVRRAEEKNLLDLDGKGRILTPAIRDKLAVVEDAAAKVTDARRKLAQTRGKAGGRIVLDDPSEMRFINVLAQETGLDARVLAAWTRQEGGNPRQDYNRLNIGWTGSGPNSAADRAAWEASPEMAAQETAAFLRGEWGGAGAAIPQIISRARGKSAEEQIRIISQSGWRLGSEGPDPEYTGKISAVYNELPETTPTNPGAQQKIKGLKVQLQQARAVQERALEAAEKVGIPLDTALYDSDVIRVLDEPTLWKQPTELKAGFKGNLVTTEGMAPIWDGTSKEVLRLGKTISRWVGHPLEMNSLNRPGDDGDHGSGNALDINALAVSEGGSPADERRGDRIAAAAVRAVGGTPEQEQQIVNGAAITINSPNGYRIQIIWKDGTGGNHWNHVHVGIAPAGEIVRPFSETGVVAPYARAGEVTGGYSGSSGGGGGVGTASQAMGENMTPEQALDQSLSRLGKLQMGGKGQPYEDGGVESAVTAIAETGDSESDQDGVKSAAEVLASLPQIGSKSKKKVPRFSPSNRI